MSKGPRMGLPEDLQGGLVTLAKLGEQPFEQLVSAIRKEAPAGDYRQLASKVAPKVDVLPVSEVRNVLRTLSVLHAIKNDIPSTLTEFTGLIRRGVERELAEEQGLGDAEMARLEERLMLLLSLDSLDATSKAAEVLTQQQRYIRGARVVTDIRPVFGSDVEDDLKGALLVHMLNITYRERDSDQDRDWFVALDVNDVDKLIRTLERAKSKAKNLKRVLEAADVPYIDPP